MERALSMSRKGKMDASLATVTLVGSAIFEIEADVPNSSEQLVGTARALI